MKISKPTNPPEISAIIYGIRSERGIFPAYIKAIATAGLNAPPLIAPPNNTANAKVAILCNHQKNVSSNIETTVDKIDAAITKLKSMKKKTNNKEKLAKIKSKLIVLKIKKETKIKMKNVSLGTSKNNYIDPRIIFSFIKKYNIPADKLFNIALLTRFTWAKDVGAEYRF